MINISFVNLIFFNQIELKNLELKIEIQSQLLVLYR